VLGEDVGVSGVSRRVDWSTERLQVRLSDDGVCEVLCNGVPVPLQEAGGTRVAGVRFRARRLERCLHPTLPAVDALDFEVFDRASGRVLASCSYEPSGVLGDRVPADAEQARALRATRFRSRGPAPAPRRSPSPPGTGVDPDLPGTLDLRAVPMQR
jgi:uncharacterized protein (DUF2126 family)